MSNEVEELETSKKMMMPGYCEIEIINRTMCQLLDLDSNVILFIYICVIFKPGNVIGLIL